MYQFHTQYELDQIEQAKCTPTKQDEPDAALEALKAASRQLKAIAAAANKLPQRHAAAIYQAMDVGWESIDAVIAKAEGD